MFPLVSRLLGGRRSLATSVPRRKVVAVLAALVFAAATTGAPALALAKQKPAKQKKLPATMLPIEITEVVVEDGGLVAVGKIGDNPFTAPITLTPGERPAGAECPILHLELGPINLDLLGLVVETSPICLSIDAESGEGLLLGNLLCAVSGLLDDGLDLGDILDRLALDGRLDDLLDGLTDLLNGALAQATNPAKATVSAQRTTTGGAVDILNLSLGPVTLELLGLVVELDDCEGGPVTIDITAERGPGNLLGNLLAGLAGLLDRGANTNAIANALNRIADAILDLIG